MVQRRKHGSWWLWPVTNREHNLVFLSPVLVPVNQPADTNLLKVFGHISLDLLRKADSKMGLNLQQFCEGKTLMRGNGEGARGEGRSATQPRLGSDPCEGGIEVWVDVSQAVGQHEEGSAKWNQRPVSPRNPPALASLMPRGWRSDLPCVLVKALMSAAAQAHGMSPRAGQPLPFTRGWDKPSLPPSSLPSITCLSLSATDSLFRQNF